MIIINPIRKLLLLLLVIAGMSTASFAADAGNFTIDDSAGNECVSAGGALSKHNIFTDLDYGSFGTGSGAEDEIPESDPYGQYITGGKFRNRFNGFKWGNYTYVSNLEGQRNKYQHGGGIYDPVNGKIGRFFVSDPDDSTPTFSHTLVGLKRGQSYEVSFWAADSELAARYFNRIGIFANDVEVYNTGYLRNDTDTLEWKKYSFVYTHLSNDSALGFDIRSLETGGSGRDFYLDEIKIHECYTDGVVPPDIVFSPPLEIEACKAITPLGEFPDGLEDLSFPKGYWAASYYRGADAVASSSYASHGVDGDGKAGEKVFKGEAFWGSDGSTTLSIGSEGSVSSDQWEASDTPTSPNLHHPNYVGSVWESSGNPFYQIDMRQKVIFGGELKIGYGDEDVVDDAIEVFVNGSRVYAWFTGGGAPNAQLGGGNGHTIKVEADDEVLIRLINWGAEGRFNLEIASPIPDCSDSPEDGSIHPSGSINNYGSASHSVDSDIRLGAAIDSENTSIASDDADGDGPDDDGINFSSLITGSTATITADVVGDDGYLQAWVDWNGDGDFDDADEQIATDLQDGSANDMANSKGTIAFEVSVPSSVTRTPTFIRFRWSTEEGLSSVGHASDGESEDYQVTANGGPLSCDMNDLAYDVYAAASIASSSNILSESTLIYHASFENNPWQGQLDAYSLETDNSDGSVKSKVWSSTSTMNRSGRDIFTYNPKNERGAKFKWGQLATSQRNDLRAGGKTKIAKARLAWVEGKDDSSLREREQILGDVVHSNINFRSRYTNYGYKQLNGNEGSSYDDYLVRKRSTKDTLFVGANDGMLHAFDADDGDELFAYIPDAILPKIATISNPLYGCDSDTCLPHEYLVDGKSAVADAYIDNEWRTILTGTLGLGGKAIYALDVTEPSRFSEDDVMWEISSDQSDYADDMGLSIPEPVVVKMQNGQWAAIVANGYDSADHKAVLFIINIETGVLIKSIDTGFGAYDKRNGLSSPTPVDSDGDYITDVIYAGDLQGNLWAFDVSSDDPKKWGGSYGVNTVSGALEPLFRACVDDSCLVPKSITAKPQVGRNPAGGLMVYFGTGKYTDVGDNFNPDQSSVIDSFYGLHDNGQLISIDNLVEQKILEEVAVDADMNARVTSTSDVTYPTKQGWYMNLLTPPNNADDGEQVISQALLRDGRLIFVTMIPSAIECTWDGDSWLMELNALDGSRLSIIPIDLNEDRAFTSADNVLYKEENTIISGIQQLSLGMIFESPAIIAHDTRTEGKYLTGTSGDIGMLRESNSQFSGRMSWTKLK